MFQAEGLTLSLENLQINGFYSFAVYIGRNSTITATNCDFSSNHESAIWILGPASYLSVRRSDFYDNEAGTSGTAIRVGNGGDYKENVVEVSDSEFKRNKAPTSGGALYVFKDNDLKVHNCSFHDNWAGHSGGALSFLGGSSERARLEITLSHFKNNTCVSGSGGALVASSLTDLQVETSYFNGNTAFSNAGTVYLGSNNRASITSSTFDHNVATGGSGGALVALASRLDLIASNFTDNHAMTGDGGGVAAEDGCVVDLRGAARFDGNTALEGRGGALSLVEGSSLQTDEGALVFAANTAKLGGAVSVDEDSSARMSAGCQTTTFEMQWADATDSSVYGWAVVRRTGDAGTVGSITDRRDEWMVLEPTAQADTSVSSCLSPGNYEIMGAEGGTCYQGWAGGYVRAVDRGGTELAALTVDAGAGCSATVNLTIAADGALTSSEGPVMFEQNVGTGSGGAVYIGTVRPSSSIRFETNKQKLLEPILTKLLCFVP